MQNNEQAIQEAMRLAQSSEGKKLIHLLQSKHPEILSQAMEHVAKGDYASAQKILTSLLSDPETQNIMPPFQR